MSVDPYKIIPRGGNKFDFESEGVHGFIRKRVEFSVIKKNHYNVGFGDMDGDDFIDDTVVSNNGDLLRVFSTVIRVIEEFMLMYPAATLIFTGSTQQRNRIYRVILTRNFERYSKEFSIKAEYVINGYRVKCPFDPAETMAPKNFFISKIKKEENNDV